MLLSSSDEEEEDDDKEAPSKEEQVKSSSEEGVRIKEVFSNEEQAVSNSEFPSELTVGALSSLWNAKVTIFYYLKKYSSNIFDLRKYSEIIWTNH